MTAEANFGLLLPQLFRTNTAKLPLLGARAKLIQRDLSQNSKRQKVVVKKGK